MATKTPKNQPAPAPKAKPASPSRLTQLAEEYLVHRVYQAITAYGEAAKVADIARTIDDDSIGLGLVRQTISAHGQKFLSMDRKWDIATRYLDRQRPVLKTLEEIVANYGEPMASWEAAHELGSVLSRSAEGTQPIVDRIFSTSPLFFPVQDAHGLRYALRSWLLNLGDSDSDSDLLFYNYLPADAAAPYAKLTPDWEEHPVEAALSVLDATPETPPVVDSRLFLFLAHQALGDDYDGPAIYAALAASDQLIPLSGHRWTNRAGLEALRNYYRTASQSIAELPAEEEELAVEEAAPLTIKDEDFTEIDRILAEAGERAVHAFSLLEQLFEIAPGDRTFQSDLATLTGALRTHPERYLWAGYDYFRMPDSLPPYLGQIPESMTFPAIPQIETAEGELLDQMLEDDGFERGLERDVLSPVAQDVNDQEPFENTLWPAGESAGSESIRCVLKAHHKEIGLFPMCQLPTGFLAAEPSVVELVLRDKNGTTYQVFADHSTQLLYGFGLFDLYAEIAAESGAVFHLQKTPVVGEFLFVNENETDPDVYVSPERLEQLQTYRSEVESGPTIATYDIVRYLLEHSNQAMSYLALLTEVNVVRRVTRRQLASILSAWSGFTVRAGLWSFDAKKAALGINKDQAQILQTSINRFVRVIVVRVNKIHSLVSLRLSVLRTRDL